MDFAGHPQYKWLQPKYAENEVGQETPPSSSDDEPEPNPAEFIRNPQPALPRSADQPRRLPSQQQQKPSAWGAPRKPAWGQKNSGVWSARRGRGAAQKMAVPIAAPSVPSSHYKSNIVHSAPAAKSKPAVMLRALKPQSEPKPVRLMPQLQSKPSTVPRAPPARKTAAARGRQQAMISDVSKQNPWTVRRNLSKQNSWANRGNSQQQNSRVNKNSQRASSIPGPPKVKPSNRRATGARYAQPQQVSETAVIPDLEGKLETLRMENQHRHKQSALHQPARIVNQYKQQRAPVQPVTMVNHPVIQAPAQQRPVRMERQPAHPQFSPEQAHRARQQYAPQHIGQRHHVQHIEHQPNIEQQPLEAVIYEEGYTPEGMAAARRQREGQRLEAVVTDFSGTPEGVAPVEQRAPVGDQPLHSTSEGCWTWVEETGCHCQRWENTTYQKKQE